MLCTWFVMEQVLKKGFHLVHASVWMGYETNQHTTKVMQCKRDSVTALFVYGGKVTGQHWSITKVLINVWQDFLTIQLNQYTTATFIRIIEEITPVNSSTYDNKNSILITIITLWHQNWCTAFPCINHSLFSFSL